MKHKIDRNWARTGLNMQRRKRTWAWLLMGRRRRLAVYHCSSQGARGNSNVDGVKRIVETSQRSIWQKYGYDKPRWGERCEFKQVRLGVINIVQLCYPAYRMCYWDLVCVNSMRLIVVPERSIPNTQYIDCSVYAKKLRRVQQDQASSGAQYFFKHRLLFETDRHSIAWPCSQ